MSARGPGARLQVLASEELVAGPRQARSSEKVGPSHSAVLLSPGTLKVQVSRFNFLGRRHSSKKEQNAARSLVTALWMLS